MTNKEKLVFSIKNDFVSEEVCEILYKLISDNQSKGTLMDIVYGPNKGGKVDSAYPQGYADQMRELNPGFRGEFMVYDYNDKSFGQFENVAERTIMKIWELSR
jgi:hypothetical protein